MGTVEKGQNKKDRLLLSRLKNDFPFIKCWSSALRTNQMKVSHWEECFGNKGY